MVDHNQETSVMEARLSNGDICAYCKVHTTSTDNHNCLIQYKAFMENQLISIENDYKSKIEDIRNE